MEDISKFLGVVNIVLISAVLKSAMILHFGATNQAKPRVVIAHWIITGLAILSLIAHVAVIENRPIYLIVAVGVVLAVIVLITIRAIARLQKPGEAKA